MTTDLAVREPQRLMMSADQLRYIANTEFVPQGLRGNLPAIMACVATGRALGIDDMSALRLIHVVNGRPTFSAELMVQIVRRHGHSIVGEYGEGEVTVTGTRADNQDTMTVRWTMAMAERAGLASKQTWKSYPESLLWARAASQLCRQLFADCFAGGTYTPEEIETADLDFAPDAEVADGAALAPHPAEAEGDGAGVASGEGQNASPAAAEAVGAEPSATAAQRKKLDVLVGPLREQGHLTTEQVWQAAGRTPTPSEDGVLHWAPLRDSLSREEASLLIDRLERYAASLAEQGASA